MDELSRAELEVPSAERTVERARRNIQSSQARNTQARAAVDQARTELQHTTIRAPFDAFVLRRSVEPGSGVAGVSQSASGGTVLMTLGDARESALYAKATASDAQRLEEGMQARIRLDTDPDSPLPGVVQSVSTAGDVDSNSRLTTFPVVVALAEQPPGGWVNVPAQAEIVLGEQVDSVAVPERCVRTSTAGQSFVYVRGQSGRIFRQVELGVIQDDRVQIRSGLEVGQTVICQSGR
jgi:RND family efflux transporter MFP subunit